MNAAIDPRPASWTNIPADTDTQETHEWQQALLAVLASEGPERAKFLLDELVRTAHTAQVGWRPELSTPYINTISVAQQPVFPGDLVVEERLASIMRWNALAMVVRANQAYGELGGHIASFASAATLYTSFPTHPLSYFWPSRPCPQPKPY